MKFIVRKCGEPKLERAWLRYSLPSQEGVDNDGDKSLTVAEPSIIQAAERECSDVVPLYYPMAKAAATEITPESLYNGMVAAWTGGNIGVISNAITKIWNSEKPDADAVKILCMENNFTIDYAKTLYKPVRPSEWDTRLRSLDSSKVPAFFVYAKGKKENQVMPIGTGTVDKLYKKIQIYKFRFSASSLGKFDYKMLMHNKNITYGEEEEKIVKEFRKASSKLNRPNDSTIYDDSNRYWLSIKNLRNDMKKYGDQVYLADILIEGLFGQHHTRKKSAFWDCFGDIIYANMKLNLDPDAKMCEICGTRFVPEYPRQRHCNSCTPLGYVPELDIATCITCGQTFKTRGNTSGAECPACKAFGNGGDRQWKKIEKVCIDCGSTFEKVSKGRQSVRCPSCQKERNRLKVIEWKINKKTK